MTGCRWPCRRCPIPAFDPPRHPAGAGDRVVYVPACTSRTMGPADGAADQRPLTEVVESLFAKSGFTAVQPEGLANLCCGLPFDSKGLADVAETKVNEMAAAILAVGSGLPVVMDASPCTARLRQALAGRAMVYDLPEFLHDKALPRLEVAKSDDPVLVHLPCSLKRMGGDAKMRALAEACSSQVNVPVGVNCCGFAGDKGLFKPELNAHRLAPSVRRERGGRHRRFVEPQLRDRSRHAWRSQLSVDRLSVGFAGGAAPAGLAATREGYRPLTFGGG